MSDEQDDPEKASLQKATMGVFFVSMLLAIAAADVFAFQNGATATISQGWLTLNKKCWPLTYALAILCGILLQHVSVARDPAHGLNPPFVRQALLWTPFFWFGLYLGYRYLYQLPNLD